MYGSVPVSFNAGALITKFFRQVMYKIRTPYISVHITTYPFSLPVSCHLFLSRNLFYIDAVHGINTTLTRLGEGIKTPLITNFTMLFVPCMPTSWSNTMHIRIQGNYINACSGGGHCHHQGRQHHAQAAMCCILLQHRACLCHTSQYV